eukprot:TRINITY_DN84470_c0_g1_i1.p1 TRINITY_DN84470_c0_g1~~TRINITY_DN84470_c0_g1_i1.p1  ORF type:complete len:573 (+),score=178.30 TRINITY_DN84470_c0_g1_i1:151-1869(+)
MAKKGKKGGGSAKPKAPKVDLPAPVDAYEVIALKERNCRIEKDNENFQSKIKELEVKLEQQRKDQADIYAYLHQKLDDNFDRISNLEQELSETKANASETKSNFESEIEQLNQEHDDTNAESITKIESLEQRLLELDNFQKMKDTIEANMHRLDNELKEEKAAHEFTIQDMDRKLIQEKERLKKEMLIKIKETKQSLLAMTEDQLATTAKRTIMENEQMTTELQFQSKETKKLLTRNEKMMTENKNLRRQIRIHQQTEEELAKKTHHFEKMCWKFQTEVQMLQKHLGEVTQGNSPISLDSPKFNQNHGLLGTQSLFEVPGEKKSIQKDFSAEILHLQHLVKKHKNKADSAAKSQKHLQNSVDATSRFLITCFNDIQRTILVGGGPNGGRIHVNQLQLEQRSRLLTVLLNHLKPAIRRQEIVDEMDNLKIEMISAPPVGNVASLMIDEPSVFSARSSCALPPIDVNLNGPRSVSTNSIPDEMPSIIHDDEDDMAHPSVNSISVSVQTDGNLPFFFNERFGVKNSFPPHKPTYSTLNSSRHARSIISNAGSSNGSVYGNYKIITPRGNFYKKGK